MCVLHVVPHAGTWIEMTRSELIRSWLLVVPLAGTWIEIRQMADWKL